MNGNNPSYSRTIRSELGMAYIYTVQPEVDDTGQTSAEHIVRAVLGHQRCRPSPVAPSTSVTALLDETSSINSSEREGG